MIIILKFMSSMFFTKVTQKSVITTKPVPGGCQKCSLRPTKTREWHQLRPVSYWRRWIPQMYCHWRWDLNAYINPETKQQLIQWKHSLSPKPKKFKQAFLARRLRLLLVGTTKASYSWNSWTVKQQYILKCFSNYLKCIVEL